MKDFKHLQSIEGPADVRRLTVEELGELAGEIRQAICDQVSCSGGHLAGKTDPRYWRVDHAPGANSARGL